MDDQKILKTLGKNIAALRKKRGMNQEEFANACGKMINTISNIERGLSDPKATTLVSFTEVLHVSLDALFGDDQTSLDTENATKLQPIIDLLKKQDEKILQIVQKQIEVLLELKI